MRIEEWDWRVRFEQTSSPTQIEARECTSDQHREGISMPQDAGSTALKVIRV